MQTLDHFDPAHLDTVGATPADAEHDQPELADAKQKREFNKLQKRLRREVGPQCQDKCRTL